MEVVVAEVNERKITACGCALFKDDMKDITDDLDLLCCEFQRGFMSAYNRFLRPTVIKNPFDESAPPEVRYLTKSEIEKHLQANFDLNAREAKDAIELARQLIVSQKELRDEYLENNKSKLKDVERKIKNYTLKPYQLTRLKRRRDNLLKKIEFYETHKKNDTVPGAIFGGKANFKARSRQGENQLSRADFIDKKYGHYYSRGEALKGGNPRLTISIDDKGQMHITFPKSKRIYSEKTLALKQEVIDSKIACGMSEHEAKFTTPYEITLINKPMPKKTNEVVTVPLYIAKKVSRKTGKVMGIDYDAMVRKLVESGKAYAVEIIRKKGKYHVHVTFDTENPEIVASSKKGIIGVDANPDGPALTGIYSNGNYKFHDFLKHPELLYVSSKKRDQIVGQIGNDIAKLALKLGFGVAIEGLGFKQNKESGKVFNRIKSNFAYRKMLNAIKSACAKHGVECTEVNPAYTSMLGLYKYCHQYGMDIHNGAAMVIARRAYGFREKIPKSLITRCIRPQDLDKYYASPDKNRISKINGVFKGLVKKDKNLDKTIKNKPNGFIKHRKDFLGMKKKDKETKKAAKVATNKRRKFKRLLSLRERRALKKQQKEQQKEQNNKNS